MRSTATINGSLPLEIVPSSHRRVVFVDGDVDREVGQFEKWNALGVDGDGGELGGSVRGILEFNRDQPGD